MKNNKKKKLIAILVLFVIILFGNMKPCKALIGERIVGYKGLVADFDKDSKNTNVGNKVIVIEEKSDLDLELNVNTDDEPTIKKMKVKNIISDMIRLAWTSRKKVDTLSASEIKEINDTFGLSYEEKETELTEDQKKEIIGKITSTDKMYLISKYTSTFGKGTELYCIQHDQGVITLDYQIKNFIQIKGNKLTKYQFLGGNLTESESTNDANAVLTYLLNREYKDYTYGFFSGARQYAVRHYINTWIDSVGKNIGINGDDWNWSNEFDDQYYADHPEWETDGKQFIKNATNYGVNSNKKATAEINQDSVTIDKYTDEIPVTLTFNGNLSIQAKDKDGNVIKNSDLVFKQEGKNVNVENIKSGTQFTITNNSSTQVIKTIDFNVTNKGILCANIWLARTTGWLRQYKIWKKDGTPKNQSQRFMVVKHYTEDTEASAHLEVSYRNGDLIINKEDADDSNKKLANVEFILKNSNGNWISISNDSYTETSEIDSASSFSTNSNGVATITNLPNDTYTIYEKVVPTDYEKDLQDGYIQEDDLINCGSVTVSIGTTATKTIKNKKYGTITITKKDEITNNALQAGFKIHVDQFNFIGLDSNGEWTYDSTFENAYIFRTGKADSNCKWTTVSDGSITIRKLKLNQEYEFWEVEAPEGYVLDKQDGYRTITDDKKDIGKEYNYVYHGNTTLNSNNINVKFEFTNIKYLSIKGYVWVDQQVGKQNDSNNLYDTEETKVAGVTVRLMKKGDTSTQVPTTTTDTNGEYIFDNLVKENEIENYYVEFNYNGVKAKIKDINDNEIEEDISKYIPVAINTTNEIGSKAIMNSVAEKDADLSGIAMTYTGTDATALSNYGLGKCGTLSDGVLSNINLGIKKIPPPDYNLTENIVSVKIVMKGYTYTYIYGGEGEKSRVVAPKVNFQKVGTISGYTANVYPSDIAYDVKNSTEELKMYVKYRIDITNTMNYDIEELYKEKTLYIKSLTDTFDTNRYTLYDDNWTVEDGVATIKDDYLKDIKDDGIALTKPATKYIEFSVKHDAILDILNNPNGIIEEYPTKATATGYHKYTRNDYSWNNNIKKEQEHTTNDQEKHNDAPYLIFKLGPERVISGKVFKDSVVTTDGQVLGNGEYDDGEKGVADVNVELLDLKDTETDVTKLSVSNVYGVEEKENNTRTAISKIAQVKTDKDGNYSLNGIVPGYYYLRFVYGNGAYKITDLYGNVIDTNVGSKIDNTQIQAKDYKSTIVTNKIAKKALIGEEDELWYKKIENNKIYSIALDNLEQRKVVNEGTLNSMMAGTAKVFINIENTDEKELEVNQNAKYDQDGKEIIQELNNLDFPRENVFKGLSFGIIEVPKQYAEIKKVITNVKLVDSEGRTLYNGNPENIPSQGIVALSDLDNEPNGGSTYVRAEIAEVNLYGSKLELTYEVRIANLSDINYYDNNYYWYGNPNIKKEVTLTPKEVMDYLDNSLTYEAEKSKQLNNDVERIEPRDPTSKMIDGNSIKVQPCVLKGWKTLYTSKNENRDKSETTDKVSLVASRILSSHDEDMEIISRAEITGIERTADPSDTDTPENDKKEQIKIAPYEVKTNGMVQALFTITPPTGKDKLTKIIYIIAGTITLVMLSIGIGVIRKKVSK